MKFFTSKLIVVSVVATMLIGLTLVYFIQQQPCGPLGSYRSQTITTSNYSFNPTLDWTTATCHKNTSWNSNAAGSVSAQWVNDTSALFLEPSSSSNTLEQAESAAQALGHTATRHTHDDQQLLVIDARTDNQYRKTITFATTSRLIHLRLESKSALSSDQSQQLDDTLNAILGSLKIKQ